MDTKRKVGYMMQSSLAERLRVLRAQRGLPLTEAAAKIGVDRHTLRRLERGVGEPRYPTLNKISRAYGVPVEELIEEPVPLGEAPGGAVVSKVPELTLEDVGAFLEREVGSRYIALPSAEWSVIEESTSHEQRQAIDREWELIKHEWFASHGKTEAAPRLVPTGGNWGDVYYELLGRRLGIRLGIPSSTAQAVVREAEEDALLVRTTGT